MKTIFTLLMLLSLSMFGQKQVDNIQPFKVGIDTYETIEKITMNYYCNGYKSAENGDTLIDIMITNYFYNGKAGYIELFIGNGVLYYVRFTDSKLGTNIFSCSNQYPYFKRYWVN